MILFFLISYFAAISVLTAKLGERLISTGAWIFHVQLEVLVDYAGLVFAKGSLLSFRES
jgi:hypothetical protein